MNVADVRLVRSAGALSIDVAGGLKSPAIVYVSAPTGEVAPPESMPMNVRVVVRTRWDRAVIDRAGRRRVGAVGRVVDRRRLGRAAERHVDGTAEVPTCGSGADHRRCSLDGGHHELRTQRGIAPLLRIERGSVTGGRRQREGERAVSADTRGHVELDPGIDGHWPLVVDARPGPEGTVVPGDARLGPCVGGGVDGRSVHGVVEHVQPQHGVLHVAGQTAHVEPQVALGQRVESTIRLVAVPKFTPGLAASTRASAAGE